MVRTREEILATLDADGTIDGLPFMPEMLEFCGRVLKVSKRAHKTCDTITQSGMRGMSDAVHLEGTRCSGKAHGGCEAACEIFWKESWLRRVDDDGPSVRESGDDSRHSLTEAQLQATTQQEPAAPDGPIRYRCQATELLRATTPLHAWDLRQYIGDVRSGNVGLGALIKSLIWSVVRYAARNFRGYRLQLRLFHSVQRLRGGAQYHFDLAGDKTRTPSEQLDLAPGELIRVKELEKIRETLSPEQKNRGLYFDIEMAPFCGTTHKVHSRVNKIINEATGEMMTLPGGCIILDNVICTGRYHRYCPRAIFPYWREIWLQRAQANTSPPQRVEGGQ